MKKCVKIVMTGADDSDALYRAIKKRVRIDGLEGVASIGKKNVIEIIAYGPKELVDSFVDVVEEVGVKYTIKSNIQIGFTVEPFLKDEDYRGIFRFMKSDPI